MVISRKSWHYRIYNFLRNVYGQGPALIIDFIDRDRKIFWKTFYPTSLCSYFWSVVAMVIFSPIMVILLALTLAGGVVFGLGALLYFYILRPIGRTTAQALGRDPNRVNKPGVLTEFVKAKKGRYCPQIFLGD